MDPDQLLAELREHVTQWDTEASRDEPDTAHLIDLAEEIVYRVADLDEWLTIGGFAPRQWRARRTVSDTASS